MLGLQVNNYEIVKLLGEGGMGAVYEAEHRVIRRKVAIKLLKRELAVDTELVQRFFNEARATSAIHHPNIVEIIDVGMMPDGVPYLVMELLEGENLSDRIERLGRLDIDMAVDFVAQATRALEAAHDSGIVHRDLKPENLFIVAAAGGGGQEVIKVLDFGIAKLRDDLTAVPVHTLAGAVLGTPPYMSPEQCRGLDRELDLRTDIYALGIILYEAICGAPPFVADGVGELMMLHMSEPPKPPSQQRDDVPEHVERVILSALAKRREERFSNMAQMRGALEGKPTDLADTAPANGQRVRAPAPEATKRIAARAQPYQARRRPPAAHGQPREHRIGLWMWATLLAAVTLGSGDQALQKPRVISRIHPATSQPPAAAANPPPAPPTAAEPQAPIQQPSPPASEPKPALAAPAQHKLEPPPVKLPRRAAAPVVVAAQAPRVSEHPDPAEHAPAATPGPAPQAEAPGYLSLDSAPWSEVFLGNAPLGTTPLIKVPLPPGKHLLTLRNSELDTQTTYAVEIKSGQTVSRLVGWGR